MRPSSSRSRVARARVLRMALGPDARRVGFADMETLGRNPGRIIGAWRDFVREHAGGHAVPVGIGEPIWPGRSPAEVVECQRHETLLNLAFPPTTPWTLLCPYDAERLPDEVLDGRAAQPPARDRARRDAPQRRLRPRDPGRGAAPGPGRRPTVLRFTHGDLAFVREFIAPPRGGRGVRQGPDQRPRARRRRARHQQPPLRPRRGHAAHLARERRAARRGRRRGPHRGPAGRPRLPRSGARSAAAACTWSTSSAISCSCAPHRTAA